jgi:hypothetical protein
MLFYCRRQNFLKTKQDVSMFTCVCCITFCVDYVVHIGIGVLFCMRIICHLVYIYRLKIVYIEVTIRNLQKLNNVSMST